MPRTQSTNPSAGTPSAVRLSRLILDDLSSAEREAWLSILEDGTAAVVYFTLRNKSYRPTDEGRMVVRDTPGESICDDERVLWTLNTYGSLGGVRRGASKPTTITVRVNDTLRHPLSYGDPIMARVDLQWPNSTIADIEGEVVYEYWHDSRNDESSYKSTSNFRRS